jgi:hypothetical protein
MSKYRRTTRECTIEQLRPELARALRDYAQQQQWRNLETEVVMCCETTAEKISTSKLDEFLDGESDPLTYLALIITPQRLIWMRSGAHIHAAAAAAQLKDVRLKIFRPKRTQDFALDVYGRMEGTRDQVGGQLILGPDPDAQKFCSEVMKAMDDLNPPSAKKPRRKWFGR